MKISAQKGKRGKTKTTKIPNKNPHTIVQRETNAIYKKNEGTRTKAHTYKYRLFQYEKYVGCELLVLCSVYVFFHYIQCAGLYQKRYR